jgi:YD repeat-containing protein
MTSGTHVLIVDDEAGFRELMRRYLEAAGYAVRAATNAHEALHSIRESPPAVTVCDIHMPGPTGLWLAEQIRQHSPATAMVLATSDAAVPPAESMRRGVVAYILKPYQRDQVTAAVATAYRWWAEQGGGEVPRLEPRVAPQPAAAGTATPAAPAAPAVAPRNHLSIAPTTILLAVIVVVLLLAAAFFLGRQSDNDAFGRVAAASGVVLVFDSTGTRVAQGSGFFVAPDLLVTNRHVVSGGTTARVVGFERRPLDVAGIVAIDAERDLALLKTTGATGGVLTLAGAQPDIGDSIAVYGAPLGLDGTLTTGIVSANRDRERGLLQITAPLSPGSSGSPVFTPDGTVVGVAVAANLGGQALSFAIPSPYVADLLARAGTPRPLVAAARGAGDDRERHQLIGPVRSAAITLGQETTRLIFDRQGRLLEKAAGDATIQYAYDEHGRLASETHLSGEEPVQVMTYVAADGSTMVGDDRLGLTRRLTYDDRHRLVAEEQLTRGIVVHVARWDYDGPGWPDASGDAVDLDALGNPARGLLDGRPVTFSYRMDGRGNWVEREATSTAGNPAPVRVDRRRIDYWD